MRKLIVIYYHDIVEKNGYSYQKIIKTKFEEQMKYLNSQGYSSILLEDLEKNEIPEKAVLITFDDGFRSVYDLAAPIMQKFQMKGNVFLATGYIEDRNNHFMTWDMINELKEKKLFSYGSHTSNHVDVRTLNENNLESEIIISDRLIKDRTGISSHHFCIPYGTYNKKSLKLLMQYYPYVYASFYGHNKKYKNKPVLFARIGISNDDTLDIFIKKLNGNLNWKGYLQRFRLWIQNRQKTIVSDYEF